VRETREELNIDIKGYKFFNKYETIFALVDLFVLKVDDNFENEITILEGDYGKWFSKEEMLESDEIIKEEIKVLEELYRELF
jgi:hypothetical protein